MGEYAHVHQTFEEFAATHIDVLYQGALFLHGGEVPQAEDLVLWTMTGAFQQFKRLRGGNASKQWLEGKIVEAFLARAGADSTSDQRTLLEEGVEADGASAEITAGRDWSLDPVAIDPEALFRAAAKLSHMGRATIWLVLFRRWRYEEACNVLKTDVDGLSGLLRGRQVRITAAVVQKSENRNGTERERRS